MESHYILNGTNLLIPQIRRANRDGKNFNLSWLVPNFVDEGITV